MESSSPDFYRRGNGKRSVLQVFIAPALCFITFFAVHAPAAFAEHRFCSPGSGLGQCDRPEGIAVDEQNGDVYVVDRGNNRVNVFDSGRNFRFAWGYGVADGTTPALQRCGPGASPPTSNCFKGIAGSGPGQFAAPLSIAIDNNPASLSYRSVYVGTDSFRVQKFDREGNYLLGFGSQGNGPGQFSGERNPIAVAGPLGTIYVGDSPTLGGEVVPRIQKFNPTGTPVGACEVSTPKAILFALAVDSSGVVYGRLNEAARGIRKYGTASEPICTPLDHLDADDSPLTVGNGLAVDTSDNFFAIQYGAFHFQNGSEPDTYNYKVITRWSSTGAKVSRFGYGEITQTARGLALRSATGDLYISEEEKGGGVVHVTPPPPGPVIASVTADPVGNTKATLTGIINPEGREAMGHAEYVDEVTYQADLQAGGPGHGFDSAIRSPENEGDDSVFGSTGDFGLHRVSQQVGCPDPVSEAESPGSKCLKPETEYRFRLIANNEDGEGNSPLEGKFTTKPALEIEATWSSEVGTDSARLNAEVNPLGIPATGYFQYVNEASYLQSGFSNAIDVPDVTTGAAPLDFGAGNEGKAAGFFLSDLAPGSYRFRVVADGPLIDPLPGPERTFSTQSTRAYSSPPCPNDQFRSGRSAQLPNCRAYEMVSPIDKNGGDIIAVGNIKQNPAQLNQSAAGGNRFTYSSYRAFGDAQSAPFASQYLATRNPSAGDPAQVGWRNHSISPPREANILEKGPSLDSQFKAFSEDLCMGWLRHDTNPPLAPGAVVGFANLYRRDNCAPGVDTYESLTLVTPPNRDPKLYAPELQGISEDGTHAVFRVDDAIASTGLKPNPGKPDDGSNMQCYEATGGQVRLVSVMPNGTASKLQCSVGSGNQQDDGRRATVTHAISEDGSRIFWTAGSSAVNPGQIYVRIDGENPTVRVSESVSKLNARFWLAAADGSKVIFTIETGVPNADDLYEFDVDKEQPLRIAGRMVGVLGASEDASRIYLVSREDLGEGASEGDPNLYLYEAGFDGEAGTFSYVGTLAEADLGEGAPPRITPSPVNIEPYFRTSRISPDGRHLLFMSAASLTGYDNIDVNSRKADSEVYLYDAPANGGSGELACISCNPTGARPAGRELLEGSGFGTKVWAAAQIPGWSSQLYPSRVLSEDGTRAFFESYEALVTRDTNGVQDVYQWERAVDGHDCEERGAELFVKSAGGCLSLISSGEGAKDSKFVDASADGSDVFFSTTSSLVPQDPGQTDIYDARVKGGLPFPRPPKAPCEGEACQSPPPPPAEVTPASAAFKGKGNLRPRPKPRCPKGKRKVRREGKVRCVAPKRQHGKKSKQRDRRTRR